MAAVTMTQALLLVRVKLGGQVIAVIDNRTGQMAGEA